jgi:hypothetical protein
MKTSIDLNDAVICTLTEEGYFTFCKYLTELGVDPKEYIPKFYNQGLTENQIKLPLWNVMKIFGNQMYMGNNKQMFVENKLEILSVDECK